MATNLRIGFIGAGNMAQAMAKGFLSAGIATPKNIIASSPVQDQYLLDKISELGCETTYNNIDAVNFADVVVLSVKPNIIPKVLQDVSSSVCPKKPLITSVAIGVSTEEMERKLKPGVRVVRILPNTPALVNLGASVFARGINATIQDAELTTRLLKSVGECDEVPEPFLDAVSGLSGAGPAYMYLVIEALADGGVKMGLPRPLSIKLAAQTNATAKMVLSTGKPPGQLKDEVCSPGGCTIEGVAALENGGLRASLINAVTNATEKSNFISRHIK
ncbi:Pyrroline-5-carboxylate reductase 2 [Armadillidium nasatum]|uniref:Pyrroline-5-carboxylate reductase n=1 Tax=Armadillidium nasatum TaxID=96803 RepID=A0A5N5TCG4_9CRUS|nr:Pyrroline-5-carboxylate reductase 2 [Armadillidium nasatum]